MSKKELVGWVNIDPDNGDILIAFKGDNGESKYYCYHRTFKRLLDGEVNGCPIFPDE